MALKAYALSWRLTRRDIERAFPARMLEILDRYHGQATGMFSGDECLSGKSPTQGTELCAVVETMYSLEHLISVTGDPAFGDRLERIAFNALPATLAPDMWSHQYDQQANQVQCTINPDHMWSSNGPESNLYGLEPNFGCCTANMHQGWPKFAAHLWMRAGDGIAAVAYAPSTARFETPGAQVRVTLDTDYPFRETLKLTVTTDKPAGFPAVLRIPAWAKGAAVRIVDGSEEPAKPGSFHTIERKWEGATEITLRFPMSVKTSRRYNEAIAIERNQKPGMSDWQLTYVQLDKPGTAGTHSPGTEGDCSRQSVAAGKPIEFFVSTEPAADGTEAQRFPCSSPPGSHLPWGNAAYASCPPASAVTCTRSGRRRPDGARRRGCRRPRGSPACTSRRSPICARAARPPRSAQRRFRASRTCGCPLSSGP